MPNVDISPSQRPFLRDERPVTDLCILMDVTGSMVKWLDEAKKRVREIFREVKQVLDANTTLRLAFVAYTDVPEPGYPIHYPDPESVPDECKPQVCDFSSDVVQAEEAISRVLASGGEDYAEDVLGGLAAVCKLSWSGSRKILIHFLDAPPHGKEHHDEKYEDAYYEDVPDIRWLVSKLGNNRVSQVMVRCGGESEIRKTQKFADVCESVYAEVRRDLKDYPGKLPKFI